MSTEAPPAPPANTSPAGAPPAPPASGIAEPWAKEWIQPDYTFNHKALERLPDHLKGLKPSLERARGLEDLLTTYQNQQVLVGKKALAPLPADAPEAVKTERKQLIDTINGVPPTPKDYGITRPQDFPESQWNQPLADSFTKWAHENSVSPAAAKALIAIQMEAVKAQIGQQEQYVQQFYQKQDQAFAQAIQQANIPADRAASLIEKGALALGLDLTNEDTKNFMKGSEARLMAMKHAIAIGEDRAVTDGGNSSGGEGDPSALAKDATSNPANPLYAQYWNKEGKFSRATQEAAISRVNAWHQQAVAKGAKAR